jgi:uncharacterized membrane protein
MRILVNKKGDKLYFRGWEGAFASTIMFMAESYQHDIKRVENNLSAYQLNKLNKGKLIYLQRRHPKYKLYESLLNQLKWLKGIDVWTKNGYEGDY